MSIKYLCPACGHKLRADAALAGMRARCTRCKQVATVPAGDSAPAGHDCPPTAPNLASPASAPNRQQPSQPAAPNPVTSAPAEPKGESNRCITADVKQIWQMAGVVALLLSFLSLGLPALLEWLVQKVEPGITILKVLAVTAPLTAALAFIGTGLIRGWFAGFWSFIICFALTLFGTALIGHWVGLAGSMHIADLLNQPEMKQGGGGKALPFKIIAIYLGNYLDIYKASGFLSSLVVAGFLAWAWGDKLLPRCLAESTPEPSPLPFAPQQPWRDFW